MLRALVCIAAVCSFAAALAGPAPDDGPLLLLDDRYPLEVSHEFHAALLHWLDSLTETTPPFGTAGKTTTAHKLDYQHEFGGPTDADIRSLKGFRRARVAWVEGAPDDDPHGLTVSFFGAASLSEALSAADHLLEKEDADAFRSAVMRFAPRYRPIWNQGKICRDFVDRSRESRGREELSAFLVSVAEFIGVEPERNAAPHVVLVPVRAGHGTHAQAIGRYLLIEVRPGETLLDEVGPIVHENVHFLIQSVPEPRLKKLESIAREDGARGEQAWGLMREALPTSVAQGVATYRLRRRLWSMEIPWYHVAPVDTYAKRLFPLVRKTLKNGGALDDEFVRKAVGVFPHQDDRGRP